MHIHTEFSCGSDAHVVEDIGADYVAAKNLVRRSGIAGSDLQAEKAADHYIKYEEQFLSRNRCRFFRITETKNAKNLFTQTSLCVLLQIP